MAVVEKKLRKMPAAVVAVVAVAIGGHRQLVSERAIEWKRHRCVGTRVAASVVAAARRESPSMGESDRLSVASVGAEWEDQEGQAR